MPDRNRVARPRKGFSRLGAILVLAGVLLCPLRATAQEMSAEMRGLFEEMIPHLDESLQEKVRDALDKGQPWLELTVEEFRRFRDNPHNPFEGWQGVDPENIKGLIRLQFETQPIRSRVPNSLERQAPQLLDNLAPVARRAAGATVQVSNGKVQLALGMVVTDQGHVLTKLSEISGEPELFCKTVHGQRYPASVIARNEQNDVALLKIPAGAVAPVVWCGEQPHVGAFVITTDCAPRPLAMGVYSNRPRSLVAENQAYLGVKPVNDAQGVRVAQVTPGSSADDAGLLAGDILVTLNDRLLKDITDLVDEIRRNQPGDRVVVQYLRNGVRGEIVATLAGRNVGGPAADRFRQMETFGAVQSERRYGFPWVFQHDTPLVPEQCGGPVINLDGQAVGMNIARGGRVATYAIPADHLKILLGEMLHPNVASRNTGDMD